MAEGGYSGGQSALTHAGGPTLHVLLLVLGPEPFGHRGKAKHFGLSGVHPPLPPPIPCAHLVLVLQKLCTMINVSPDNRSTGWYLAD